LTVNFSKVADKVSVSITNNTTRLLHKEEEKLLLQFVKHKNDAEDDVLHEPKCKYVSIKFQ